MRVDVYKRQSMVRDGLWDIYNDYHMGVTGENVAEKYGITREEQDEFAVHSHRKAVAAMKECRFKSQIVPVEIPAKKKGQAPLLFEKDESPREDTTCLLYTSHRCSPWQQNGDYILVLLPHFH